MSSSARKTQIVCLTPVRNEAWILERFLKAAELCADHIVLADQDSTEPKIASTAGARGGFNEC